MADNKDFIPELLGGPLPAETRSDCSNCVMAGPAVPGQQRAYFVADVRCCSYEPSLPNYLVGRILRDGNDTMQRRLARRVDSSPWGVRASRRFDALYHKGPGLFGFSPELKCPHLLEGNGGCSIWQHRNSTCRTWFCKHDRGKVGNDFWLSLHRVLTEIERSLGIWCVAELHTGAAALNDAIGTANSLNPEDLGGAVDEARQAALWGQWAGREQEFYLECAAHVDGLKWSEVERIGGVGLRARIALLKEAYQQVTSLDLPKSLKTNPFRIVGSNGGKFSVSTYSGYNPLEMSQQVLRVLPYFDGRPVAEALAEVQAREGLRIQPGLLRKLADFEILGPAD